MRLALFLALGFLPGLSFAQTGPTPDATTQPTPANHPPTENASALQISVDRLAQSNRDLLDLLKKQQAVLEDMQFDRRLQSRQIESLEERLQETLLQNAQLQNKIDNLATAAATAQNNPALAAANSASPSKSAPPPPAVDTPPPPPASYLPDPEPPGAPGVLSWHRLFVLSGTDNKTTDLFHIQGKQWRVLWHNQDKAGKEFQNTSALFVNAFPRDDTIPQKVCAKLGTGGDATELMGPGNFYLKIEGSGGSWEVAVEDYQ